MTQKHAPSDAGGDISSQLSAKLNDMDWDARLEEARERRAKALAGRPPEPERPSIPPPQPLEKALPPEDMISEETLPEDQRLHQPNRFGAPPPAEDPIEPPSPLLPPEPETGRADEVHSERLPEAPPKLVEEAPRSPPKAASPPEPAKEEVPKIPPSQSAPEVLYGPDARMREGVTHIHSRRRRQNLDDAGLSALPGPPEAPRKPGDGDYGLARDGWVGLRDGQIPPGESDRWVPPSRTMVDTARSSFERIAAMRGERSAIVTRSIILTTPEGGVGRGGRHDPHYGDSAFGTLEDRAPRQIGRREPWALMAWGLVTLAAVAAAMTWGPGLLERQTPETFAAPPSSLATPPTSLFAGQDLAQPKPVSMPPDHTPVSHPTGLHSLPALLPPIAGRGAEGDRPEPPPARTHTVRIFVAAGAPAGVELRATERIEAGPSRSDGLVEVDYRIRSTHTRYFHRQDWAEATRLARALGGEARNFTRSGVAPPRGYIELYVRSVPAGVGE